MVCQLCLKTTLDMTRCAESKPFFHLTDKFAVDAGQAAEVCCLGQYVSFERLFLGGGQRNCPVRSSRAFRISARGPPNQIASAAATSAASGAPKRERRVAEHATQETRFCSHRRVQAPPRASNPSNAISGNGLAVFGIAAAATCVGVALFATSFCAGGGVTTAGVALFATSF